MEEKEDDADVGETLDELVSRITASNCHAEIDMGVVVGNEIVEPWPSA